MSDEASRFAREFLNSDVLVMDMKSIPPGDSDLQEIDRVLELSTIDPDTNDFDVLVWLASNSLLERQILPEWLAKFAADVLTGARKRPTKRGADKYSNWVRDYELWRAVDEVSKRFCLPKYDNTELYDNETAAGAVSRASGCSIDVVVTAYKKFNRLRSG